MPAVNDKAVAPIFASRSVKSMLALSVVVSLAVVTLSGSWINTVQGAGSGHSPLVKPIPNGQQGTLHRRSCFYVGGNYTPSQNSAVVHGQMYVEHLVPAKVAQKYPIVMIHGNGMTGTNFLNTPDGRLGWGDYFMSKGYELYLVDQPARARSPWQQGIDGPQTTMDALYIAQRLTGTQIYNLWPQASLHTQWPGNGTQGDPIFDNFYMTTMPSLSSSAEASAKVLHAGVELLDQIGPAILLTHSQSGQFGWQIADARPSNVKAIIALEPIGPPFIAAVFPPFTPARPYGLTELPVTFSPPIHSASDLHTTIVSQSTNYTCIQQTPPARQLVNLAKIPVLVLTSESGYHAVYDDCSARFLRDAGVHVDHVRLEDVGIRGNGHMMFMELNGLQIVEEVVLKWLRSRS